MEESKHISYFKVENFKRFESFEMENIGQFNLIVGDNNVGKTTILEALLYNEDVNKYTRHLFSALSARGMIPNSIKGIFKFYNYDNNIDNEIIYHYRSIKATKNDTLKYKIIDKSSLNPEQSLSIQNKLITNPGQNELIIWAINGKVNIDFPNPNDGEKYLPYVWINLGYSEDLSEFYSKYIGESNTNKLVLINDLKVFIPQIWDLEISSTIIEKNNFIIVKQEGYDKPIPITLFGEGAIKLIRILLEIYICTNGRLMIDEIDTGIYHGRFKKFWKTILLAAYRNKVQLFATTHSKECLKFIKEVLEEDEELKSFQKDMRCFRLVEHKDKSVKSYSYDFEQFQFAIDHENEIR
jgi:AAA15 family ATPase/GTPase